MLEYEIIKINKKTVACDGGDDLGHPTIYLKINEGLSATCPYCSRQFAYEAKRSL